VWVCAGVESLAAVLHRQRDASDDQPRRGTDLPRRGVLQADPHPVRPAGLMV